ncbi:hypothetical protein [Nocardia niigatensis]|nr:hypothetical protein [Nocardia niigatensis]
MKRLLFLIMTIVCVASTYDYARSPGHYGLVVVMGIVCTMFLIGKTME